MTMAAGFTHLYDWDVPFDRYYEAYSFGNPPTDQ